MSKLSPRRLASELKAATGSRVAISRSVLRAFSHDASLFEIRPTAVVYPETVEQLRSLVDWVSKNKSERPELSLTARSGGTDMSGGAINDSIVISMEHLNNLVQPDGSSITVQPGVYYRDFEPATLAKGLLLPSYPASRELCTVGGMVANNSGGEKSLVYGKTDRYVRRLKVILHNGKEYVIEPVSGAALKQKLALKGLEGNVYREIYELLVTNRQLIQSARPNVSKNSTGYSLWDAWDGKTLDLTKLFVGSQGTLGLITEITFGLVPAQPLSGMLVAFLPDMEDLGEVINTTLTLKPTSLESFDEHTLKFAFRFFFSFRTTLGWKRFILLGLSFIPVLRKLLRYLPSLPKLILMAEFEGQNQSDIDTSIAKLERKLAAFGIETQRALNKHQEEKFWIMRRESFNLLRKNIKRKHTAPFIDDLIVPPACLAEFLPRLSAILDRYQLLYTVAGHMGDGNFHIIPLMNLSDPDEREKIPAVLQEVTKLVMEYDGSLSGEHNDGLIRGPFLNQMYSPKIMRLFIETKSIFDPQNIFNPHKKTTADWDYSSKHIRKRF